MTLHRNKGAGSGGTYMALLQANNLVKSYNGKRVVDEVSFAHAGVPRMGRSIPQKYFENHLNYFKKITIIQCLRIPATVQ